jgi:hypothetical protein
VRLGQIEDGEAFGEVFFSQGDELGLFLAPGIEDDAQPLLGVGSGFGVEDGGDLGGDEGLEFLFGDEVAGVLLEVELAALPGTGVAGGPQGGLDAGVGIGNGCPLAAVVTTQEIAKSLASRIHFNTFGGNPVSCAQGRAVLRVIEHEGLQANCLNLGAYLTAGFEKLAEKHSIIGQVRGKGLMLGVELVKDRGTKEPAREQCAEVFERCKDLGLLMGKGGLWGNTLRIKPPMSIHQADADFMLEVVDAALTGL